MSSLMRPVSFMFSLRLTVRGPVSFPGMQTCDLAPGCTWDVASPWTQWEEEHLCPFFSYDPSLVRFYFVWCDIVEYFSGILTYEVITTVDLPDTSGEKISLVQQRRVQCTTLELGDTPLGVVDDISGGLVSRLICGEGRPLREHSDLELPQSLGAQARQLSPGDPVALLSI